jgi:small subunit ribosomal protein S2
MSSEHDQVVTMKQLLEAGVHFGHQTRRWHPKMKPFIFQERNGIYILDLQQTLRRLLEAYDFVKELTTSGTRIIFVGTKKQASDAIAEEAQRCAMPFINQRWLGGMLTNFQTISRRIKRLKDLEAAENNGDFDRMPKKEAKMMRTQLARLRKYLGGVSEMTSTPSAMFIVDLRKEYNAFLEAKKLNIPVVALVDTNCDPTGVDYPIPGNDDAIRAVRLIARIVADACIAGQQAGGFTSQDFEEPEPEQTEQPVAEEAAAPVEAAEAAPVETEVNLNESEVFADTKAE